jgi:hypothetical protein
MQLCKTLLGMKKSTYLLLTLILWCIYLPWQLAAQPILIENDLYQIDHVNQLILVNQNTGFINTNWPGTKTEIYTNQLFTFVSPTENIEIGNNYLVVDTADMIYNLYFTELPIISIYTTNQIVDEPRVFAHFRMAESNGNLTESNIGIEYRGGWTQNLPKKSLRIEFWQDTIGEITTDVSLLGMRSDDDWNLQALFNEPLRLRTKINNEIWKDIHTIFYSTAEPEAQNGIDMEFSELFINGLYQGLYAVGERIDRKQLQLEPYNGNIRGQLYKGVSWGGSTFSSLPNYNNNSSFWGGFEYTYPREEIDWSEIHSFVDFVINESPINFYSGYQEKFHLLNAVDYFIFLNLIRATDNFGKNIFIGKYSSTTPYFYIPWDLDGAIGTDYTGQQDTVTNDLITNGFYNRLLHDCYENGFYQLLQVRWNNLRNDVITPENLTSRFSQEIAFLQNNGVYERESLVWPTYAFNLSDLTYISSWVEDRISYLDSVFSMGCIPISVAELHEAEDFLIFPNPASDVVNIVQLTSKDSEITILDLTGRVHLSQTILSDFTTLQTHNLPPGVYVITLTSGKQMRTKKLVIHH